MAARRPVASVVFFARPQSVLCACRSVIKSFLDERTLAKIKVSFTLGCLYQPLHCVHVLHTDTALHT
jgi:hypothetical protein